MLMRRIFTLTACTLLLTVASFASVGNIAGTVQLPDQGGPAAGATVTLYTFHHDSLTATADSAGQFEFDSVAVGEWAARATLDNYLPGMDEVRVRSGRTSHLTLTLRNLPTGYGRVTGTVQLPDHAGPAGGATVVLFRARGDSLVTAANDTGFFAFDSARVGTHDIYATMDGYAPGGGEVRVRDGGTTRVTLVLNPIPRGFGRVEGTVQLPDHAGPAGGATVVLFRARGDSLVTAADDSGFFVFDTARIGRHDIYATMDGYAPGGGEVRVRDGGTTHVTLVLRPIPRGFGRVEGTVLLPDHAGPAGGATVVLFRARGDSLVTAANDSGVFAFDSARIGEHDIYATLAGYQRDHRVVHVPDGGTAHIILMLHSIPQGIGRVQGIVLLPNNAGPAVGAAVVLFRARGDSLMTASDDSGHFAFDSARVGVHDIHATLDGYSRVNGHVWVMDGRVTSITLTLGDTANGHEAPGAQIVPQNAGAPVVHLMAFSYPNPFNPTTSISFAIPEAGMVKLTVYNIVGQKISDLVNGYRPAGESSVSFDGMALPAGLYIYRLSTAKGQVVGRMLLEK